jgi:hypothetical protein
MTGRKKASATANTSLLQIPLHQKKHLQQQISHSCRYRRIKKSICDIEYPTLADTTASKKTSATANNHSPSPATSCTNKKQQIFRGGGR